MEVSLSISLNYPISLILINESCYNGKALNIFKANNLFILENSNAVGMTMSRIRRNVSATSVIIYIVFVKTNVRIVKVHIKQAFVKSIIKAENNYNFAVEITTSN